MRARTESDTRPDTSVDGSGSHQPRAAVCWWPSGTTVRLGTHARMKFSHYEFNITIICNDTHTTQKGDSTLRCRGRIDDGPKGQHKRPCNSTPQEYVWCLQLPTTPLASQQRERKIRPPLAKTSHVRLWNAPHSAQRVGCVVELPRPLCTAHIATACVGFSGTLSEGPWCEPTMRCNAQHGTQP